jgi:hypothetical protein
MIYKKAYIGKDPKLHPANSLPNPNGAELSQDDGQYGIYYLSKFRGLHNHPLEMSYIYAETRDYGDAKPS